MLASGRVPRAQADGELRSLPALKLFEARLTLLLFFHRGDCTRGPGMPPKKRVPWYKQRSGVVRAKGWYNCTVILKIARACGFLHSTSPIPPMDINATRRFPQT